MIDAAKGRAAALAAASILGFAGVFVLADALTEVMAPALTRPGALFATALIFIVAGAGVGWLALRMDKPISKEGEELVDIASTALADLPVEAARKLIIERPVAALALSSGLGALLARRPAVATDLLERLIARLL